MASEVKVFDINLVALVKKYKGEVDSFLKYTVVTLLEYSEYKYGSITVFQ